MSQERTRKIVITAIMGAISAFLGITRWGYLPSIGPVSVTIMHIPVIIGAILEGPLVGAAIGLIFGLTSMLQAAVAPINLFDPLFINPLLAVLPRLFIGPVAWLVWRALKRWPVVGLITAAIAGSLTNTILVLGMLGVLILWAHIPIATPEMLKLVSWPWLATAGAINGLPEAIVAAVLVLAVVSAWKQIRIGRKQGSSL